MLPAQIDRDLDLAAVRVAVQQGAAGLEGAEERWRARLVRAGEGEQSFRELFGYDPPGLAVTLGYLHAFLYEKERRPDDARLAAEYLARMAGYRAEVPADLRGRAEYADGLPAVPSFFQLADYCRAWRWIRSAGGIDPAARQTVEEAIAGSAEFVLVFPEWGPHNRAMLRAESLLQASLALPDDPRARRWRTMAEVLAEDSLGAWEIEDAQVYQPIWLGALLRYADAAGDASVVESVPVRYYLRYFQELLTPLGTLPDFGDAWWNTGLERCYFCLEWGAAALRDPELKWAAGRVWAAMGPVDRARAGLGLAMLYAHLDGHVDGELVAREPSARSGPVLDDAIGKKLVFRTGRGADDLYLLLNFRDEGDTGVLFRDYLRQTLAVEEEKMHHGHADENAIVLFMDKGSVLLHDAGYRDAAPSGPYGAYRADLFHNRLCARLGELAAGQDLFEFLRDSGAYRRVRTEMIDFVSFECAEYGRTRVGDDDLGYVWDRTVVFPREPRMVVVFDTVRVDRPGYFTFSTLWAARELKALEPGFAVGVTDRIEANELPASRALLVAFPGAGPGVPGVFPLRRHRQDEQVVHETESRWFDRGSFAAFVTVLWPIEAGADAARTAARVTRLDAVPDGRAVGVRIESGAETITIGCKADLALGLAAADVRPRYDPQRGRCRYGDVATDGDLVVVRRRGQDVTWCATGMTHVQIGGQSVFEAKPFQVFQTTGRSDVVGRSKWRRWEERARLER